MLEVATDSAAARQYRPLVCAFHRVLIQCVHVKQGLATRLAGAGAAPGSFLQVSFPPVNFFDRFVCVNSLPAGVRYQQVEPSLQGAQHQKTNSRAQAGSVARMRLPRKAVPVEPPVWERRRGNLRPTMTSFRRFCK
jgi:hypothetical protein